MSGKIIDCMRVVKLLYYVYLIWLFSAKHSSPDCNKNYERYYWEFFIDEFYSVLIWEATNELSKIFDPPITVKGHLALYPCSSTKLVANPCH